MIVPGLPETQVANNVVGFLTSTLRSIPSLSESTTNGAGSSFLRLLMLKVWQRFSSKLQKLFLLIELLEHVFSQVTVLTLTWYLFPWSVDSSSFCSMSVNTRPMFIPFSFVTTNSLLILSTQVPKFHLYTAFYQERVSAWTHKVDGLPSNVIVMTNL